MENSMKTFDNAKEAKAAGSKTYFTGKPCKHGHTAERFSCNSECVECDKIRKENRKKKVVFTPVQVEIVVPEEKMVLPVQINFMQKKEIRVVKFRVPVVRTFSTRIRRPIVINDVRI